MCNGSGGPKGAGGTPPGPNSFNFMQFMGNPRSAAEWYLNGLVVKMFSQIVRERDSIPIETLIF